MQIQTHTEIGRRDENQDLIYTSQKDHGFLLAVADGHGKHGAMVAERAIRAVKAGGAPKLVGKFQSWIARLHRKVVMQTRAFTQGGSTLSIFYHLDGESHIYQVGDSPIFVKTGNTIQQFRGHGVDFQENDEDLLRAVAAGGKMKMINESLYLTSGKSALRVTRALGNSGFGAALSSEPLIKRIDGIVDSVMVASDGFTGEKEEVFNLMKRQEDISRFVELQKKRGVGDNMSITLKYLF
jgi:serine/threonine protein phosphatase PrpC